MNECQLWTNATRTVFVCELEKPNSQDFDKPGFTRVPEVNPRLTSCSEISCNVKLNVYLAMEIPDRVSFVSGQNSDEIVRSCELSW